MFTFKIEFQSGAMGVSGKAKSITIEEQLKKPSLLLTPWRVIFFRVQNVGAPYYSIVKLYFLVLGEHWL